MSAVSFSKNIPDKIGNGIEVSGKNTLIDQEDDGLSRVAIADEPIDAKIDGKKFFCVRIDNAEDSDMKLGFTPMETFDSKQDGFFGNNGFTGCGIRLDRGNACYPVNKSFNVIDKEISKKATEIIVILTISNNGKKREICFLCDGVESKSTDASEYLKGDVLFPAICFSTFGQKTTTIPIDEIKIRTPAVENLIKEYQAQQNNNNQSAVAPSAAMLQLQNELAEARQKTAALSSSQLQEQKQKSSDLENELQKLNEQKKK